MARTKVRTKARGQAAARRAITPEDVRRLVFVEDVQVAPDASRVAFVRKQVDEENSYAPAIWSAPTDGSDAPRALTSGGKDRAPRWSPDGTRLAFISKRDDDRDQLFVLPMAGGEACALTSLPEGDIASYRWSPTGDRLVMLFRERAAERTKKAAKEREEKHLSDPPWVIDDWFYRMDGDGYFGADRFALYVVDAETGAHRLLYGKDRVGASLVYDVSPDGKQLAVATNTHPRAASQPERTKLVRIDVGNGKVTPFADVPASEKHAVAWSPDGTTIAVAGYPEPEGGWGTENVEVMLVDAQKGGWRRLTADADVCLGSRTVSDAAEITFDPALFWTADGKRLITYFGRDGAQHVTAIDAKTGRVAALTSGRSVHSVASISRAGDVLGLTKSDPKRPSEVHVARLDGESAKLTRLTSFNRALLSELDLAGVERRRVPSTDGTAVHTWVMRPPDCAPRAPRGGRPCVLEVHGGPHCQYGDTFFHEFQVLAAQGYVVVFSNPRGSKGYGRDHCAAIKGDWGHEDWDDIQAVTAFMQQLDGVDTSRLGIMGGSYGGYMTNWAIGHTREFKAAITDRCVSNMVSMFGNSDIIETPDGYWQGNTWDRTETLWAQSPLRYLGNCKTPTLVIHSEGDLRCNVEQGEQVHMALSHLGVPTRFVRYPRSTSHGMSRAGPPDLRIHRLHQILEWWRRRL